MTRSPCKRYGPADRRFSRPRPNSGPGMKIDLLCVGRLKDEPERLIVARYLERFQQFAAPLGFAAPVMTELPESRAKSPKERKTAEAAELRKKLKDGARVIVLDERGQAMASADFATLLAGWRDGGYASSQHCDRRPRWAGCRICPRRHTQSFARSHDAASRACARCAGRAALSRRIDIGGASLSSGLKYCGRSPLQEYHETLTSPAMAPPSLHARLPHEVVQSCGLGDDPVLNTRMIADWR